MAMHNNQPMLDVLGKAKIPEWKAKQLISDFHTGNNLATKNRSVAKVIVITRLSSRAIPFPDRRILRMLTLCLFCQLQITAHWMMTFTNIKIEIKAISRSCLVINHKSCAIFMDPNKNRWSLITFCSNSPYLIARPQYCYRIIIGHMDGPNRPLLSFFCLPVRQDCTLNTNSLLVSFTWSLSPETHNRFTPHQSKIILQRRARSATWSKGSELG